MGIERDFRFDPPTRQQSDMTNESRNANFRACATSRAWACWRGGPVKPGQLLISHKKG